MGYDLIPKNTQAGSLHGMIFTWPVILNETGACYLFGYGENTARPGFYIYNGSRGPGSPVSNDGFRVTAAESKIIARLFRGYVFVKRAIRKDWDKMSESEQNSLLSINKRAAPPSSEFIDKVESLIEFCEKSGGFIIK
ncbi:MAG: hypothetical protein LUE98_07625 [Tannerellaceae bacterium]|nr:hypothetical protein [Tannerellaceae bacterium]